MTFEFDGCFWPSGEDENYDGFFMKRSEIDREVSDFGDEELPIHHEHDYNNKIGTLKKYKDKDGKLCMNGKIDITNPFGDKVARGIQKGEIKHLSVGLKAMKDHTGRIVNKKVIEVSTTVNPAVDGTSIFNVKEYPESYWTKRKADTIQLFLKSLEDGNGNSKSNSGEHLNRVNNNVSLLFILPTVGEYRAIISYPSR